MEANWKQTLTAVVRDNRNDGKPWKMVQKFKKKKKSLLLWGKKIQQRNAKRCIESQKIQQENVFLLGTSHTYLLHKAGCFYVFCTLVFSDGFHEKCGCNGCCPEQANEVLLGGGIGCAQPELGTGRECL